MKKQNKGYESLCRLVTLGKLVDIKGFKQTVESTHWSNPVSIRCSASASEVRAEILAGDTVKKTVVIKPTDTINIVSPPGREIYVGLFNRGKDGRYYMKDAELTFRWS